MRARFTSQQLPVKVVQKDGTAYVYICANETQGTENYPDMGDGQTQESYYEYDYNEIIGPVDALPLEDIQAHPEKYLDYAYTPEENDPGVQALSKVQELEAAIERGADHMTTDALESVIRYARTKLMAEISEMDDKTEGIACKGLFPVYEQNYSYSVGDVRLHPATGNPKECMTAYDGSVQPDWTIDTATLWKPWHSRKKEYALPWEAPTGAHDMYKAGEYMIWTDGTVKKCRQDTNFSPEEYPQAWEDA